MKSIATFAALAAFTAVPKLSAQVPPGMFAAADSAGRLHLVEPFTGAATPVTGLRIAPARRLAVMRDPSVVFVAVDGPNLTTDVVELTLVGSAVSQVRYVAAGLAGRAVGLYAFAPDASAWLTTHLNVYELPVAARARPVFPTRLPAPIVGSGWVPGTAPNSHVLTVVLDMNGGTVVGQWFPPTLRMSTVLGLGRPAHAFFNFGGVHFIGVVDQAGEVFDLDRLTFAATPLRSTGVPVTGGTVRADDSHELVLTSALGMHRDDGRVVQTGGLALPGLSFRTFESTLTAYGTSCVNGGGARSAIETTGGAPFPGSSIFEVTVFGAPRHAAALLLVGVRRQDLDLTPSGLTGCRLLIDPIVGFNARHADEWGEVVYALPIPEDRGLIGGVLTLQAAVADPAANAAGWITTRAAQIDF